MVDASKGDVERLFSQRVGWPFGCANLFVTRLAQLITIARRSFLKAVDDLLMTQLMPSGLERFGTLI